jgi:hypothetical protein
VGDIQLGIAPAPWIKQIHRQILQITRGEVPEGLVNQEVWDKPEFRDKLKTFREAIKGTAS